ncbi:hypothetical protein BpHYR1_043728 [Brachionus plicatilis]|uniref:Uncharacterized protein n=1 Tax=Brachionus plicatilis TaxID=10195 RepID=A0A3M7Q1W3_BRAPC|nr:hypothetical protein BpHYR1_043728 [Brachionus plicatilis]
MKPDLANLKKNSGLGLFLGLLNNSANEPKARPIEDFFGYLKAKVYKGDCKAKNLNQLENKIPTCLSNMDSKVVQDHAKTLRSRLDIIGRHGVQFLN